MCRRKRHTVAVPHPDGRRHEAEYAVLRFGHQGPPDLDDDGGVVFFATPQGGQLGVFAGPDPVKDRILAVGDPFQGSHIASFALNPVSMNAVGQLAIRVQLTNGHQQLLRADPRWAARGPSHRPEGP